MRGMDGRERNTKEENRHSKDGQSHGNIELIHDHPDTSGVGIERKCAIDIVSVTYEVIEPCNLHSKNVQPRKGRTVELAMQRPIHGIERIMRPQTMGW